MQYLIESLFWTDGIVDSLKNCKDVLSLSPCKTRQTNIPGILRDKTMAVTSPLIIHKVTPSVEFN